MDNAKAWEGTMTKEKIMALTANDWQLYTAISPWEVGDALAESKAQRKRSERAAVQLNKAFVRAISKGRVTEQLPTLWEGREDPKVVAKKMEAVQSKYASCGATDTEPRCVLQDLLEKVYGSQAEGLVY